MQALTLREGEGAFAPSGSLGNRSEDRSLAVLCLGDFACINHLLEQSGSLVTGDSESVANLSGGQCLFSTCESFSDGRLDSLVFLLSLGQTLASSCLANTLERTFLEELEVFDSQTLECDSVDSFLDCNLFHFHHLLPFLCDFIIHLFGFGVNPHFLFFYADSFLSQQPSGVQFVGLLSVPFPLVHSYYSTFGYLVKCFFNFF